MRNIRLTMIAGMLFLLLVMVGVLALTTQSACAASRPYKQNAKMIFFPKMPYDHYLYLDSGFKYKIKKCKSSDKAVAVVTTLKQYGVASPVIKVKKPGTAKLTIVARKGNSGKYKNYTTKLTAYNCPNAFKSFRVGDKNLTGRFKGVNFYQDFSGDILEGTVQIKPAKGWVLKKISVLEMEEGTTEYIRNGGDILLIEGSLEVVMRHKASGLTEHFYYSVNYDFD